MSDGEGLTFLAAAEQGCGWSAIGRRPGNGKASRAARRARDTVRER